jgi:hypothetical protein
MYRHGANASDVVVALADDGRPWPGGLWPAEFAIIPAKKMGAMIAQG